MKLLFILFFIRCDGYYDCKDESDEDKCNKISVPNTYLSYVPAPPSKGQLLADINISVDIVSVLDLIEVDSVMTVIFKLTLRWRDSRVTFRNLKDKSFLNMVGRDDASKIWYPRVIFYNTRNMEETQVFAFFYLYFSSLHFHLHLFSNFLVR